MGEPTTYEINKETDWRLTIPLILWTGGLICMTCFLTLQIILDTRYIGDFIPVIIVMILIAFFSVNIIRWQLFGKEVIHLDKKGIEVENQGTFFNDLTKITYAEMDTVSYDEDEERSLISFWSWRTSGGKIKIQYLGRTRRFGQSITIDQAEDLANKIKEEFKQRKNEYIRSNISHLPEDMETFM